MASWLVRPAPVPAISRRWSRPLRTGGTCMELNPSPDFERFRLRTFVDHLVELGEVEVHDEAVRLIDLSRMIESTDKASLFKDAGPQHYELVAAVCGSRARVAAAFGVDANEASREYLRRLETPQPIIEVPTKNAPVHEVIAT